MGILHENLSTFYCHRLNKFALKHSIFLYYWR